MPCSICKQKIEPAEQNLIWLVKSHEWVHRTCLEDNEVKS